MTRGPRRFRIATAGRGAFVIAGGLLVACAGITSSSDSTPSPEGSTALTTCAAAQAVDAGGCAYRAMFDICQVPPGAIVGDDGAVATPEGGTVECTNACGDTDYALTCTNAVPPDALGCRDIATPTPDDVLNYCCPCTR